MAEENLDNIQSFLDRSPKISSKTISEHSAMVFRTGRTATNILCSVRVR